MRDNPPHSFEKIVTSRLTDDSSLEDIERVASITKIEAETLKAKREAENARSAPQWEFIKSLTSILIPIVSLITLTFTLINQSSQLDETRRQNEVTQWRDFVKGIRALPDTVISDPTVVPELKSFLESKTVGPQAHNLAKSLTMRIADKTSFNELLLISFPDLHSIPPQDILDLSRDLRRLSTTLSENCYAESFQVDPKVNDIIKQNYGICNPYINSDALNSVLQSVTESQRFKIIKLRNQYASVTLQAKEVSQLLADSIRKFPEKFSRPGISLKDIYIYFADFSDVDFKNIDINNAIFDGVNLTGASFLSARGTPQIFNGSNWWQAKNMSIHLLNHLKDYSFPGAALTITADDYISKEKYIEYVKDLYKRSGARLEEMPVNFPYNPNFKILSLHNSLAKPE